MNNSTETNHASMPLGIFASKSIFRKTNLGEVGPPPYVASYKISIDKWIKTGIITHVYSKKEGELCYEKFI